MKIDLNADLGEGMDDAAILPFLTSANVACGMHAGDPSAMDRTVELALKQGVRIGAHPGYADKANFGRTDQELSEPGLRALLLYQLGAIDAIVRARGGVLRHVKAHGALYNRAAKDRELARVIAETVRDFGRDLVLVGLAGSVQIDAARAAGLKAAGEAFADRRYLADGSLMPRSRPGAVLHDPAEAAAQALRIVREGRAQTLCMHGDTPGASAIAAAVRAALESAGVAIAPL
ncbi:MAG: LamB/YcsF family protein [Myxococcales bacterium]|nr:LamB/YcsF family protein [Myxococcales bacterium]